MLLFRYRGRVFGLPLLWIAIVGWTLVIAASLSWNLFYLNQSARGYAAAEARGALNKDLVYRRWAALHGGVYVPVSTLAEPNPYLSHVPYREVTTTDGQTLTLVNPAYMTRQVHELGLEQYGLRSHITSANPLRPENAPDAWELKALRAFEGGKQEVAEVQQIDGAPHLRLMTPMHTEEGCLKCHAAQGYEVGEVRGGLSVSVPLAPYHAAAAQQMLPLVVAHLLLWIVGLLGLWAANARLRRQRQSLEIQNEALLRAQQELDTSQARYFNLFDRAPVGFCTVNAESLILESNAKVAQFLNVPQSALPGQALTRFVQDQDRARFEQRLARLIDAETPECMELQMLGGERGSFWARLDLSCALDAAGMPSYRVGMTDITEIKQAQEVLRIERQRLQYIIEAAQLGTWEWNVQTQAAVISETWASQLGYTLEELTPSTFETWANLSHPSDLEEAKGKLAKCMTGASPAYECALRMRHKQGHWVWILAQGRIMTFDEAGMPLLMFGTHQDITSRMDAETALLESEEDLEVAQRIAELGSWRLDIASNEVRWSAELYAMYGLDPTLPPPPYSEHSRLFTPESWIKLSAALEITRRTGIPYEMELDTLRQDGQQGCMWVRGEAVKDAAGEIVGLRGVAQDISIRKAAELALRESEEKHRALVASLPDIVKRFDREGRHLYVSENVREIADLEASEFIGKTHRELGFPEAQCAFWEEAIQRVFSTGAPYETELAMEGRHGPMVHQFRLVPERNEEGEVRSVLAVRRDITKQRRAERDYKTLFREMLEGFAVHEIICDDTGKPVDYRFLAVNPGFERMTGLRSEDVIGKTVLEVLPGTESYWIETYGKVALSGEPAFLEQRSEALGKFFEVRVFRPALNQFACIFEDITERKRLEEQLRQAQKMEAIGRLAGGVAHDFNNILQIILMNTEVLQEEHETGTPARKSADDLKIAAEHAADLTRQLLTFSRRQVTQPVPLNLHTLIQGVAKMMRRLIGEHIMLSATSDPSLDTVVADKGQIEQVLMNLCVNARDAMPNGGALNIEASNIWLDAEFCGRHAGAIEGRHVLLSVSDTGLGMDEETRMHIFEPFFTTKGVGEGTGLGLATVYGVVKQHNGFIHVYSEPGMGTVFQIYLPSQPHVSDVRETPVKKALETGTETVLVAEDEPAVLELLVRTLRRAGYEVHTASNGIEALQRFEEHADTIQLVILDVVMPGMGGREVMDQLLAKHAGVRILFSSGYSDTGIHKDFVLHGGLHFIQKPYQRADLLRAVRQALDAPPMEGQLPPAVH